MTSGSGSSDYWGKIKDGLSLLVIPLLLWGVKLETTLAVQEERISSLISKIEDSESALNSVEVTVIKNSLELVKVSGKLDTANEKIDVIKGLLTK